MEDQNAFEYEARRAGVGLSDAVLIGVSLIGFAMLSVTIYSLIWMRLDHPGDDAKDGEKEVDYDEMLDKADVSKLNRAQRRARAKNRMKKQRRIEPAPTTGGGADEGDPINEQAEEPRAHQQHLSRKERQKAAKAMERKERRLFEDQRRELQRQAVEAAQREKKERDLLETQQSLKERLARQEDQQLLEQSELEAWNTFLVSQDGKSKVSVQQFLDTVKAQKHVLVDDYAEQLCVSSQRVVDRIRELQELHVVTGVWDGRGRFIHVTPEELNSISKYIEEYGRVSSSQLAEAIRDRLTVGTKEE